MGTQFAPVVVFGAVKNVKKILLFFGFYYFPDTSFDDVLVNIFGVFKIFFVYSEFPKENKCQTLYLIPKLGFLLLIIIKVLQLTPTLIYPGSLFPILYIFFGHLFSVFNHIKFFMVSYFYRITILFRFLIYNFRLFGKINVIF